MAVKGMPFCFKKPTLSDLIKRNLERYSDGQIFKEMIQNADDAEASKVQFYFDSRQHGTSNLVAPELANCQGPALLSANDAVFKDKDWDGILSLQQSTKAEDPFKIGKFGIGFQSVYHLTDVPSIISGEFIAFLNPQENIWKESGQKFMLNDLPGSDHLNCLDGIASFDSKTTSSYPQTLFRFPLRAIESNISDNIYTTEKINELIDALKSEATLLLLFLRSVHTIEVYNINSKNNKPTLMFETKIGNSFVSSLKKERATFVKTVKKYRDSIQYDTYSEFDVSVYDCSTTQTITSHWLVCNLVDSTDPTVRIASIKQKVFPGVGTALEMDAPVAKGRIFCFLPMPIKTTSDLPVHINGTFSLNDDRCDLKWPGEERRNDDGAKWNELLVNKVLPTCYSLFLLKFRDITDSTTFYKAWPDAPTIKNSQWGPILKPLFTALVEKNVIWCQVNREWVSFLAAVFIPKRTKLESVIQNVLAACDVKLAQIPSNIWNALEYLKTPIIQATAQFTRDKIRSNPQSYSNASIEEKLQLLIYCSSDSNYAELLGLNLLPIANNSFVAFQGYDIADSFIYLCTTDCPSWLLPNLQHKLVDATDNPDLNHRLTEIAQDEQTQLRELTVSDVASMLDEVMAGCRYQDSVTFPNSELQSSWVSNFWKWIRNKDLNCFQNTLIFPVQFSHNIDASRKFQVVKLKKNQSVFYFNIYSRVDDSLLSILDKLRIQYCIQANFKYVRHDELSDLIQYYDPATLLDKIRLVRDYSRITFTSEEARCLMIEISKVKMSLSNLQTVKNLKIFSSCSNSKEALYSVSEIKKTSNLGDVVVSSTDTFDMKLLPSTFIVLSSENSYQRKVLSKLGYDVTHSLVFISQLVLPRYSEFEEKYIDGIMKQVLDLYPILACQSDTITSYIQQLQFVKTGGGFRKKPCELYDPNDRSICNIFKGENVFPLSPYDSSKYLNILCSCGLKSSVDPQSLLDVIYRLSLPKSSIPQGVNKEKQFRIRAIIKYISKRSFSASTQQYTINPSSRSSYMSFDGALKLLSQSRSWLPIISTRPSNYPSNLPWKGEKFTCHVTSLNDSTCLSTSKSATLPLKYGTQAIFTEKFDYIEHSECTQYLVPHLLEVITYKQMMKPQEVLCIVKEVYHAMEKNEIWYTKSTKWVYIQKICKFVHPSTLFLKYHSDFRTSLEPYLNIIPDSISDFKLLFSRAGMKNVLSQSQIFSVLNTMKGEIDSGYCSVNTKEAWSLILSILNWLTDNGTKKVEGSIITSVFVPCDSHKDLPCLKSPEDLVYTDSEFLRDFAMSTDEKKLFVHERINQSLAKSLCVTPLSEELGVSEDILEDAGQYEPLIIRLKNILKDYKDGLSIIKEMIQNADDARASVIKICFDNRQHTKDRKKLLFPDMCKAHGPAIVVYNDSKFSNEDFKNIRRLAGATKNDKDLKIGKFGIGFCSVYHITDVPSFVSGNLLHIFDPTLEHLGTAVNNHSQPGKKINFLSRLIQQSSQMQPYEGLFDFDHKREYNGTLFRLPIRTSSSELSNTCYSKHHWNDLLKGIREASNKLLLFLRNVKEISVLHFETGMSTPETLFKAHKSSGSTDPLTNCSKLIVKSQDIEKKYNSSHNWLVATYKSSCNSKPVIADLACQVQVSKTGAYKVDTSLDGEIFCSLPLCQTTGLPVHVSCNFAVINNRRGLWTGSDKESIKNEKEVDWNIFLMKEVIPVAYIKLLLNVQQLQDKGVLIDYEFYNLWPLIIQQQNPWKYFKKSFYSKLSLSKLFYSNSINKWLSKNDCKVLDLKVVEQESSLKCIQDVVKQLRMPVVNLPEKYRIHLNLQKEQITEIEFLCHFFKSLTQFNEIESSRNSLILYILEYCGSHVGCETDTPSMLSSIIRSSACIPTSPDGHVMRKCCELVHPNSSFAELFEKSNHCFPLSTIAKSELAMMALKKCGLMHTTLTWEILLERAEMVQEFAKTNKKKALKASHLIINTIYNKIHNPFNTRVSFENIPFLPVLKKPNKYPLSWYGDQFQLLSGKELIKCDYRDNVRNFKLDRICGSQVAFVCEEKVEHGGCGYIHGTKTQKLLGLKFSPTISQVVAQLKEIIKVSSDLDKDWVSRACSDIYDFFETALQKTKNLESMLEVKNTPMAWNGERFLSLESLSRNWKLDNGPYLFKVPAILSVKADLMNFLSIKKEFDLSDAILALKRIKQDFGEQPISEEYLTLIKELILVFEKVESKKLTEDCQIYLPGKNEVMYLATSLFYNNTDWIPLETGCVEVHSIFSKDIALKLRVMPTRSKILEKYTCKNSLFKEFGQHEDLTTRIQGIIRDYDFDITILKELLQNADDAKSNRVCFILDRRQHEKTSVLSENWKELQGPALLVWNDSDFSETDFEGIQKIGLGSKRHDEETIGKYGIGFNVVYHVTDCPSFISGGETLCIFDPHCRYVPQASERRPGAMFNLTGEFWDKFCDLKSAYLQNTDKLYEDFQKGTLFRFPLRHTEAMVKESKIFDPDFCTYSGQIETDYLSSLIHQWMPKVKESITFLNHVNEIKYMEITSNQIDVKFHYKTLTERSAESFHEFEKSISSFSVDGKASVIQYQISISELADSASCNVVTDEKEPKEMKWLVQQGIGDLNKCRHEWSFSKTMKPRHAIAVPLTCRQHDDKWRGSLFCFLPLPSQSSEMPAHINGSFFLDSHRRGLWKSSNSDVEDDRSRWNSHLLQAIASSYAQLLITVRNKYMSSSYEDWHRARQDLHNYYFLYNHVYSIDIEKNPICVQVFKKLIQMNAEVLCVLASSKYKNSKVLVEWHPIISEKEADQVYFWSKVSSSERKIIHPIVEAIGMKISPAPTRVRIGINNIITKEDRTKKKCNEDIQSKGPRIIPVLLPKTAFEYYTELSKFSKSQCMKTCHIESTEFKTLSTFLQFLKYILGLPLEDYTIEKVNEPKHLAEAQVDIAPSNAVQEELKYMTETEDIKIQKFPSSPFSHFLLVTADGMLRSFDSKNKVLNSTCLEMFPNREAFFLHPELQELNLDHSYFITLYEGIGDLGTDMGNDFNQILSVLGSIVPPDLHDSAIISESSKIISTDTLIIIWKCLQEDKVFNSYCGKILKHYSLLLTSDNRLFSTRSDVLPCILEQQATEAPTRSDVLPCILEQQAAEAPTRSDVLPCTILEQQAAEAPTRSDVLPCILERQATEAPYRGHIIAIMKAIQMPFLNTDIVPIIKTLELPSLLDHDKVLRNFYYVNQQNSLSAVLKLNTSHYEALISYFSEAAKPSDDTWLHQISSLPLFITILGQYLPLLSKRVYVCPEQICTSGYEKWTDQDSVIIQQRAHWTKLGSPEQFKMKRITHEELYCKFIFPNFSQLSELERYEHLNFIKKFVFYGCKSRCSEEVDEIKSEEHRKSIQNAKHFMKSLNELKCMETGTGHLLSISSFSDCTVELFQVFPNDFYILPERFRKTEWQNFFKKFGLQQRPTKRQFVKLCQKVDTTSVENIKKCSLTLLKYLFCKDTVTEWWEDQDFLCEISNIAFVLALDTSKVNWISHSKSSQDDLVCLNGSATEELMNVLWTVQPIVHIPLDQHQQIHNHHVSSMLNSMNFTSVPDPRAIVRNIQNICDCSPYTSEGLLQKYPTHLMPGYYQTNLLKVMLMNFQYILKSTFAILRLNGVSCIPVFCVPAEKDERKIALVHPETVIATKNSTIESCYPYLHSLPTELLGTMPMLVEIGIKSNLEVYHMRLVLEKIYASTKGEPLDPNSMNYVKMALNFLTSNIKVDDSFTNQLNPLYLPDTENQLRLSTNMLYSDTLAYHRNIKLDLRQTSYYHFDKTENNYGFCAPDLCRSLPEKVRPKALSLICKQIPDESSMSVSLNERTQSIETSLHESSSLAIVQAFTIILNRNADTDLDSIIHEFLMSLKIDAKQNMKTKIVLRDSKTLVGYTNSKFYFESYEIPRTIFIDEEYDEFDLEDLYIEIADALCQLLLKRCQLRYSPITKELTSFIERYLKIESCKKEMFLQRYDITLVDPIEEQFQFRLGQVIPNDYHHKLDQDISNLFWPMELVAYEVETQHYIVAQVIRLVRSDEDDQNSNSQVTRNYLIRTSSSEMDEGKIVSIVNLYKITANNVEEKSLLADESMRGTTDLNNVNMESDISDIKLKIQRELQEICKLDPELQKMAFRRLYLIWHPDKNLDNPSKAEEIFTYLKREIERLDRQNNNRAIHSEDLESDIDLSCGSTFRKWDDIASSHRDTHRKAGSRNHIFPPQLIHPDPEEGKRWIQQAEVDFGVLCIIHDIADDHGCKFHGHVCFMAQQVAEKALKGGVYTLCGLEHDALHHHDIIHLAQDMETVKPDQTYGLVNSTVSLTTYYLNTRYPNRWSGGSIPADHYDAKQADHAKVCAQNILDIVKAITNY